MPLPSSSARGQGPGRRVCWRATQYGEVLGSRPSHEGVGGMYLPPVLGKPGATVVQTDGEAFPILLPVACFLLTRLRHNRWFPRPFLCTKP